MRLAVLLFFTVGILGCGGSTGGTYVGDVVVSNSSQLENWMEYSVIEGNLTIKTESDSPTNFAWVTLERVTGILTIQSNHRLKGFSLSALEAVDLALVIKDNDALVNFNMESLRTVGSLGIQYNDLLWDCVAEGLLESLEPALEESLYLISDNGGPGGPC